MPDYVGFGSEVEITDEGTKTTITIANKKYPSEKIKSILDSVDDDIEKIKKNLNLLNENQKHQINDIIKKYEESKDPVSKLKLLHALVKIGSGIATIAETIIEIKTKLGL